MADSVPHYALSLPLPAPRTLCRWPGLPAPAPSLALTQTARAAGAPLIVICPNESEAYRLEAELRFFAGDDLPVLHLPDTEVLPYDAFSPHQELISDRFSALANLPRLQGGLLVTTAESLLVRLPPQQWLEGRSFSLTEGDRLDPQAFRDRLAAAGYQSVSEVQTQGEFAVRGALVDLFPMGGERAYRIDLFDEDIESIRVFDPESQRSGERVRNIRLLPAREFPTDAPAIETFRRNYRAYFPGDPSRSRIYESVSRGVMPAGIEAYLPLFFERTAGLEDYLPDNAILCLPPDLDTLFDTEWSQIHERHERYSGNIERPLMAPDDLFRPPHESKEWLQGRTRIELEQMQRPGSASNNNHVEERDPGSSSGTVRGHGRPRPSLHGRTCGVSWKTIPGPAPGTTPEPLEGSPETLAEAIRTAPRTLLIAESPGRIQAVRDWLQPHGLDARRNSGWHDFLQSPGRIGLAEGPLQHSLRMPDGSLLLSEAQIFGLRARVARPRARIRDPETLLRDLSALNMGSPVVHVEHGVGRYQGLTRLDAGGVSAEYMVLEYAKGDRVYVPVTQLNLVHRYTGAEADAAPLHALGSERWKKAAQRARKRAHDVAAELLQIQARRAAAEGTPMALDEDAYHTFCEAFPFDTTADQQRAIDDVLADMATARPMDRVVCGDVGFGKTEVALRAAFAAVAAGRQVCVLVPTTLLAQQHYKNFCDRFADQPVKIAVASRLKSDATLRPMLKEAAEGRIDILIGTHRLLQPDVRFARLGLVIVDEEHRFGVRHKERLKELRAQVDLLTLTATPIPRTLNMSLAGLRDLSIIATPPEGRVAIKTFVADWERGLVQEAFQRELKRGGQIYYLHNQVRDIERVAADLRELVPEARIRVAHGQMRARELEQVMLDFYHHRFDVLCCTTIIESGIDVPNANTMVINRADAFGLAQLHQLRGRVGRSHHRAYAYLLVPARSALKDDAQRRLEAIEALGELGSGFLLATQDLEIRGAGELLGEEQSGQIEEVGFTLYAELLEKAVKAVRGGRIDDAPLIPEDCTVDIGFTSLIPEYFVPDIPTRLSLYQRITAAADGAALDALREEAIDRFGELPAAAATLFAIARLRQRARDLGVSALRAGARSITVEFGERPQVAPAHVISLVQKDSGRWRLDGPQRLLWREGAEDSDGRIAASAQVLDALAAGREPPRETLQ